MPKGDIFPPSNLPNEAVPWGREMQNRVFGLEASETQADQKLDNGLRATSGQLAAMARQIDELAARRSHTTSVASVSVTGDATINPFPQATRTWTMPPPDGSGRPATILISGTWDNSGGIGNTVQAFMEVIYDGVVVSRSQGGVPVATSAPDGWESTANVFFTASIPLGTPSFSIRITRVGFVAAPSTLTLSNIVCTLQYGDRA